MPVTMLPTSRMAVNLAIAMTGACSAEPLRATQVRGLLISLKEAVVVVGILLGYLGGALWIEDVGGWRLMFGSALFPAVILCAGMFWLMESPRWLLLSGAPKAEVSAELLLMMAVSVKAPIDQMCVFVIPAPQYCAWLRTSCPGTQSRHAVDR